MSSIRHTAVFTGSGELSLSGTITSSGTLTKQTNKNFLGTITSSGVVAFIRAIVLTGVLTFSGNLIKSVNKIFSGVLTFLGFQVSVIPPQVDITLHITKDADMNLEASQSNDITLRLYP